MKNKHWIWTLNQTITNKKIKTMVKITNKTKTKTKTKTKIKTKQKPKFRGIKTEPSWAKIRQVKLIWAKLSLLVCSITLNFKFILVVFLSNLLLKMLPSAAAVLSHRDQLLMTYKGCSGDRHPQTTHQEEVPNPTYSGHSL